MPLRKSPTLTPARIEASRHNAQKSTGPRTARGKAQSSLNSLRTGGRSTLYRELFLRLLDAPPYSIDEVAQAILTPQQAVHPLFSRIVDEFRQNEIELELHERRIRAWHEARKAMKDRGGRCGKGPAMAESGPTTGANPVQPKSPQKNSSQKDERSLNVIENTGWRLEISYDVIDK
jgi:hypothetical protein